MQRDEFELYAEFRDFGKGLWDEVPRIDAAVATDLRTIFIKCSEKATWIDRRP